MVPICGFNKTVAHDTARETIQLLHETFPGRVISRFGDQNWPPNTIRFLLMGFFEVKGLC